MSTLSNWKIGGSAMPLKPVWELNKRPPTGFSLDGTPKFQGKDSGRLTWDALTQSQYDSLLTLLSSTTTSVSTTITVPDENGTFVTYNCICLRPTWSREWNTQGVRQNVVVEVIELSQAT